MAPHPLRSSRADGLAVHGATEARGLYGSTPGTDLARSGAAELIGTFVLVLAGTATAVGWLAAAAPGYDLLAVVLAFGLALVLVAAWGAWWGGWPQPSELGWLSRPLSR